jgi:hypothetical protein
MEPKDVRQCVERIATHPVLKARYGKLIEQLPSVVRFALATPITWFVVEELLGSSTRFLGTTSGGFVTDDFLRELKTTPSFWVGPELVKRIAAGKSPFLSEAAIRNANSQSGLSMLAWHLTCHPQDILGGEIGIAVMTFFDEYYQGFRLREVIGQADCLEHMYGMGQSGGLYFNRIRGAYVNLPEVTPRNFSDDPRNIGLTRDLALSYGTSRLSSFFVSYTPPRFGLARSEQKLLILARDGSTDEQLSSKLGVSLHAVKMRWRMIYDRVAAFLPDLVADSSRVDGEAHGRGKEKKQRLLDYMRKHPEELRPVSRKLLNQGTAAGTSVGKRSVAR